MRARSVLFLVIILIAIFMPELILGFVGEFLMAKSRHASLRSLQRYARPGAEAVAALTAATDPARRRR
jgi:hypothetical protein